MNNFHEQDEPVSKYDYHLPEELIAQHAVTPRSASKLLVFDRKSGSISHRSFSDVLEYVMPGDLWVFNDTRVFPARIFLQKNTGAKIEILFLERTEGEDCWKALARPGKRLSEGTLLFLDEGAPVCVVVRKFDDGTVEIKSSNEISVSDLLSRHGEVPLPPYIKEKPDDYERYQTIYSRNSGSSAAPTAGLHFTEALMAAIREQAETAYVTLQIGMDTFRPIKSESLSGHVMHTESVCMPRHTIEAIERAKGRGARVVAVGTTSVRALEAFASEQFKAISEDEDNIRFRTDIFIRPGYAFRSTDAMVTNFHLPKSTLLVLVSAFAGRENIFSAYDAAVADRYRFYSFGDAMLIL